MFLSQFMGNCLLFDFYILNFSDESSRIHHGWKQESPIVTLESHTLWQCHAQNNFGNALKCKRTFKKSYMVSNTLRLENQISCIDQKKRNIIEGIRRICSYRYVHGCALYKSAKLPWEIKAFLELVSGSQDESFEEVSSGYKIYKYGVLNNVCFLKTRLYWAAFLSAVF